jgi:16S rRNA (adenine1518-N6/adenine1519-N6)-dimethyltransferase
VGDGLFPLAAPRQHCLEHPLSLSALDVPGLLRRYGLHPEKSLGQNFLVDEYALRDVVRAAEVSPEEVVLEIGPGLGSLTRHLAISARFVVAVELDSKLIAPLKQVLGDYPNVRLVQGDILALNPAELVANESYLVVANIPYYITSALLRHLLEASLPPSRLVLTIQREVARRICAEPGEMSLLALSVQVYGHPTPVAHITAGAFFPEPKVESTVLRIDLYPQPLIPVDLLDTFFHLIKAGFSQKRKTLRNALSSGLGWKPDQGTQLLQGAGIDPQRRAETLSVAEWGQLTIVFLEEKIRPG